MRFPGKSAPAAFASAGSSKHGNGSTFSLGVFAAMLVCAVAFLGIGTSAASAATPSQSYSYTNDFGPADASNFAQNVNNVLGVANDGKVFIVRQADPELENHGAFDVLDPTTGASLARADAGVNLVGALAVSADGSVVYRSDALSSAVMQKWVRTSTAPLTYTQDTQWSPQGLENRPQGLAVDPVTGDLLVSAGKIFRFDATSGALLQTIDGSNTDAGGFFGPASLAVAPNRDIYVVDNPGRVHRFAADGTWKGTLTLPTPSAQPNGLAVNPQNGDVAVELPPDSGVTDAVIRLYSSANDLKDVIRLPPNLTPDNHGLAFSPDGSKLYIGLLNDSAHVLSLGTQPGVDAPVASNVTPTGAHVTANVASGGEPTKAWIEYCLASDPCETNLTSEGPSPWHRLTEYPGLSSDPGQDTIEDDLTGLTPNTKYLLRAYAINEGNGVENRTGTVPLSTTIPPPLVTTAPATDISDSSAQLVGSVDNTFGDQTTFHFEYGLTTSYGSRVPAAEGVAGNLRTPRTFSRIVNGLQPGTTYHYRLVATNSGGSAGGADHTFTTLGVDEVAPGRGYEQVTPVDKKGMAVTVDWGLQASPDGSAMAYSGTSPPSDGSSSAVSSRYISRRGSSDWIWAPPLDPPFHPSRAVVNSVTLAVSEDFEHALVVSQVALAPGATEDAANLYLKDVDTGAYRFVGSSTDPFAFTAITGIQQLDTFVAGAPDFSWLVLISRVRLLPGAPQTAMYKWTSTGGLSLISLLPDGSVPTGRVRNQGTNLVTNRYVSDDGDTVVFSLRDGEDGVYRRSGGQTEAVSVSQASGGPTGVQPAIADDISRDGRYVVFHSGSQLTDDDQDGLNSEYRYDASSGGLEYLGPQDSTNDGTLDTPWVGDDAKTVYFNSKNQFVAWREGQGVDVISPEAMRGGGSFGSPNGRYFEFLAPDGALRLYDAEARESTCLSCRADGSPAAAYLPSHDRNLSNRVPQAVTDDGHAYFTTRAALLSADRNGTDDVYEYFRGRLTLISPGDGDFKATLSDISADGSNVFFQTAEGLVSQDTDQTYDVYDARIGGGLAAQNPPPPAVPCAGDACQGAGTSPPAVATPGSLGSRASSNAKPRRTHCAKNKRKVTRNGKTRCVKKKPQHNKKRHAKRNRGTGR